MSNKHLTLGLKCIDQNNNFAKFTNTKKVHEFQINRIGYLKRKCITI